MPHMEGIFINGEKAKFHPEDILDTDASQYTEEIGESVTAYLTEHLTNPPIDTSLSIAGAAAGAKETGDKITQLKSDFTALESDGVVPSAEQILTDKGITDSVPYHYRKTGGDGADRLYDQIVGGTVCFNQFANNGNPPTDRNGITFTNDGNSFTMNGTSEGASAAGWFGIANSAHFSEHVVLTEIRLISGSVTGGNSAVRFAAVAANNDVCQLNSPKIVKYGTLTASYRSSFAVDSGCVFDNAKCRVQVFDLTQMFGTTFADYIYSLETAHTGDGVAFFKALFPNDYYPYNAGELVSVSGLSAHKMTGFNQWDEEWEVGGINSSGEKVNESGRIRGKNYNQCLPSTQYYVRCSLTTNELRLAYYDAEKNHILNTGWLFNSVVTTPANAHFFIPYTSGMYGAVYKNDICINISSYRDGTYEPYKAHSYPLDSTLTLRGLFKLDANNNLYADGDTYDADGTVTRRYGVMNLGTLNWSYNSGNNRFDGYVSDASLTPQAAIVANAIASKYITVSFSELYADTTLDKCLAFDKNNLRIRDMSYTDAAAFKAAMSGVMLVYELATPVIEEADPYQHLQQCDPNGTEEFVSTGIVPVGHETRYPENLRAKIEGLPWNFASLIAPTEFTFTATRNYVTGDLFIVQNVLYKATSNIANGGTITPNTNCTATTLAEIISALA